MEILLAQAMTSFDLTQVYPMLRGEIPLAEPKQHSIPKLIHLIPVARLVLQADRKHLDGIYPDAELIMISISDDHELILQLYRNHVLNRNFELPLVSIALESLPDTVYVHLFQIITKLREQQLNEKAVGEIASEIGMLILTDREKMQEFTLKHDASLDLLAERLVQSYKNQLGTSLTLDDAEQPPHLS